MHTLLHITAICICPELVLLSTHSQLRLSVWSAILIDSQVCQCDPLHWLIGLANRPARESCAVHDLTLTRI